MISSRGNSYLSTCNILKLHSKVPFKITVLLQREILKMLTLLIHLRIDINKINDWRSKPINNKIKCIINLIRFQILSIIIYYFVLIIKNLRLDILLNSIQLKITYKRNHFVHLGRFHWTRKWAILPTMMTWRPRYRPVIWNNN